MIRTTAFTLALLVSYPVLGSAAEPKPAASSDTASPHIGHMVYFKLRSATPENCKKLVDACEKYLRKHEGVVYFGTGVIGKSFDREVNDRAWDVALHVVFVNKAAHDKYQDHPEHLKFIAENKELWESVRVFDSELAPKNSTRLTNRKK
jgi:hypothetical protein